MTDRIKDWQINLKYQTKNFNLLEKFFLNYYLKYCLTHNNHRKVISSTFKFFKTSLNF